MNNVKRISFIRIPLYTESLDTLIYLDFFYFSYGYFTRKRVK